MLKHVVLFKFKESLDESTKKSRSQEIKTALESLYEKIEVLKGIEVGLNCNADEKYDLALITEFENMKDLKTYATHPEHLKVLALIKEIVEKRACVDYLT
ncbi:Dabb family protein [Thermophagus xiamenensis]|uniref:Stress responsive A/B Barrel Domain n=1 Tax=Thermophagus xiamenensis TaxID=385682 RepID=A0A1I1XRM8_9BACT|nr:Dabb family protein [Thermophagus xiamenensis]SFE10026.1 Stress responsive A/B Barrel Domain [Thermophagus xiamenensis]